MRKNLYLFDYVRGLASRVRVAVALEVGGVAAISLAGFVVTPALGLLAAGAGMLAFGVAAERD